jgi:hypothetical protein
MIGLYSLISIRMATSNESRKLCNNPACEAIFECLR